MAKYPEIQRRAQAEIEDVVGKDTLPSVEDDTRLPYVVAVMKESLRCGPVAPLGESESSLDMFADESLIALVRAPTPRGSGRRIFGLSHPKGRHCCS